MKGEMKVVHPGINNLAELKQSNPEKFREVIDKASKSHSTDKGLLSHLRAASKNALCKNCKAQCPMHKLNVERDNEQLCTLPEARAKSLFYDMPVMNGALLEKLSLGAIEHMIVEATEAKELKMLHDVLINHKREFYPDVVSQTIGNQDLAEQIVLTMVTKRPLIKSDEDE